MGVSALGGLIRLRAFWGGIIVLLCHPSCAVFVGGYRSVAHAPGCPHLPTITVTCTTYLESQVAGNNRPLYPKVGHYWFKVAHNYEPLALQVRSSCRSFVPVPPPRSAQKEPPFAREAGPTNTDMPKSTTQPQLQKPPTRPNIQPLLWS